MAYASAFLAVSRPNPSRRFPSNRGQGAGRTCCQPASERRFWGPDAAIYNSPILMHITIYEETLVVSNVECQGSLSHATCHFPNDHQKYLYGSLCLCRTPSTQSQLADQGLAARAAWTDSTLRELRPRAILSSTADHRGLAFHFGRPLPILLLVPLRPYHSVHKTRKVFSYTRL